MPESLERAIRARSVWSGTISFGLVSIPVTLLSATRSEGVSLRMLDDDGTPLARRYYDPETGEEVGRDAIVRGYEVEDGEYVVVTDEELEAVEPEKTRDIDLRRFVDREAIDPVYYDRAYFLVPSGDSTKAYRLLAAVMERTGRAGIATFVMRTREYLVAILADNGILRAETLRFHDEIRSAESIGLPEPPAVDADRVESMRAAIEEAALEELDETALEDGYAKRLRALVASKRESGADVVTGATAAAEEGGAEVIDLMEVLKRSLQDAEPGARRPRRAGAGGGGGSGGDEESLEELTKAELYDRAQERDIPGRSSMKKSELIEALRRSA